MCVTCCRDIDGFNVKDFVSEAVKGYSCIQGVKLGVRIRMEAAQGIPKVIPMSQTPTDTATSLITPTLREKLFTNVFQSAFSNHNYKIQTLYSCSFFLFAVFQVSTLLTQCSAPVEDTKVTVAFKDPCAPEHEATVPSTAAPQQSLVHPAQEPAGETQNVVPTEPLLNLPDEIIGK